MTLLSVLAPSDSFSVVLWVVYLSVVAPAESLPGETELLRGLACDSGRLAKKVPPLLGDVFGGDLGGESMLSRNLSSGLSSLRRGTLEGRNFFILLTERPSLTTAWKLDLSSDISSGPRFDVNLGFVGACS